MCKIKDTNGNIHTVSKIIRGESARKLQIYPGFVQVNINNNTRAITLTETLADRWLAGEIRVNIH